MTKPSRRAHLPADVALVQRPDKDWQPAPLTPRPDTRRRIADLERTVHKLENEVRELWEIVLKRS